MKLPGINVQAPWPALLLSGEKTIETRRYPLPQFYIGKDLWLIETPGKVGKFKARVVGVIRFCGLKHYKSAAEFNADFDLHRVDERNPSYAWKKDIPKYGWLVERVKKVQPFEAPSPRGIVYCGPFDRPQRIEA